jgi:hypothetical protein
MKRTENLHRIAKQLAHLRAVLLGDAKARYNVELVREVLRPSPMTELAPEVIQQFFSNAVPVASPLETPCLYWKGPTDSSGYGIFYTNGRRYAAHRLAYVLTHGPVPKKRKVCHACDTPACIRWEHLSAGTHEENMRQKAERGRAYNQHTPAMKKLPKLPVTGYVRDVPVLPATGQIVEDQEGEKQIVDNQEGEIVI